MKGKFENIICELRPVIVDFHAEWCSPCKMQSPILKEVASELADKIRIIKIDVDQNSEIAGKYNIQSVPTLMIFKNGKAIWRQSGVTSKNQLKNVLSQYFS
jgi:thioredoxin 1